MWGLHCDMQHLLLWCLGFTLVVASEKATKSLNIGKKGANSVMRIFFFYSKKFRKIYKLLEVTKFLNRRST